MGWEAPNIPVFHHSRRVSAAFSLLNPHHVITNTMKELKAIAWKPCS
jgi:hypothetical protein